MFIRIHKATDIDDYLNIYFQQYKDKIYILLDKMFKDEDVWGVSKKQYEINQLFYAVHLIALLYNEYKLGLNTDWNYYVIKYDLENVRKKIACHGLYLSDILDIFNIPYDDLSPYGIGNTAIELDFIVEDVLENEVDAKPVINIEFPIVEHDKCYNNIERDCDCLDIDVILLHATQGHMIYAYSGPLQVNDLTLVKNCKNNCY